MAMHDEVKEQHKKLKGRSFREKLEYFWYYYKIHVFAAILAAAAAGIFIRDMAASRPEAFSAVLLNAGGSERQADFQADFAAYAGIDTEAYDCAIDTGTSLSVGSMSQTGFVTSQKLIGLAQAGNIDVMVSDSEAFESYAEGKMFLDLREELTPEEYSRYREDFYYIDYTDENGTLTEENVPVGICLKDSAKLKEWGCYSDAAAPPIFGFVYSSKRPELCRLFLEYLTAE